jgi:acetamidase/formamidase
MHALQGDGEIAGHTADVAGTVTLEVEVIKGLSIDGPILFPVEEDLPFLARPLSDDERERALALARREGLAGLEESLPISVIGTGPDLNSATDNALARAAELLEMSVPEVANRATISGAVEIGRHPGVVHVTFRAPVERLAARDVLGYAVEQYGDVPRSGAGGNGSRPDGHADATTAAKPGTEGSEPPGA